MMNEKFKSLAMKSGLGFYLWLDGRDEEEDEAFEKYSEMLIQECISVMVENDYHGEWLGEKIKEHFGIES